MSSSKKKESEGKIQLDILKYLRKENVMCWRQGNHALYDTKTNTYRENPYAMRGVPDIICILEEGTFCGIEVKTKTGRQSADQKFFEKRCDSRGALYHVVRSLEDVKKLGLK